MCVQYILAFRELHLIFLALFFIAVFALWKVPHLLPAFLLKGAEVSRFVLGGADLMFPGIQTHAESFPSFSAGEPWTVKVPGNPAPIAVSSLKR